MVVLLLIQISSFNPRAKYRVDVIFPIVQASIIKINSAIGNLHFSIWKYYFEYNYQHDFYIVADRSDVFFDTIQTPL